MKGLFLTSDMIEILNTNIDAFCDAMPEEKYIYAQRLIGSLTTILQLAEVEEDGDSKNQQSEKHVCQRARDAFDLEKAKALRKAGWSYKQIAEEMYRSETFVYRRLQNAEKKK